MFGAFTEWRRFPDPRKGELLIAPFGPGCYELRRSDKAQLVLFGKGGHVASRMSSLLPSPWGAGTRNNTGKRSYIWNHLAVIEYRTIACATKEDAAKFEALLAEKKRDYLFRT
jgi:hypothetical protein